MISGTFEFTVQIGTSPECVTFLVAEWIPTFVILVRDFSDVHVEAFHLSFAIAEMDDVSTLSIVRQPSNSNTNVPIQEENLFFSNKNRSSPKLKIWKRVRLKLGTYKWTEITKKRDGTLPVDLYQPLYIKTLCLDGSVIADVRSYQPLLILIASFSAKTFYLLTYDSFKLS